MGSVQRPASSGSDGDPVLSVIDERKRKRMLSNRESARRSRMRKQKQLEDLTHEVNELQISNRHLVDCIKAKEQAFAEAKSVTDILKAQAMELADRLRFLNSILEIAGDVSGHSVSIPEITDPLLKPWQIPHQFHPIMATANMNMY